MTPQLRRYVELEKIALRLETIDEDAAEAIRRVMDDVWYGLSTAERQFLDGRTVAEPPTVLEQVRLPVTAALFETPAEPTHRPIGSHPITGWRSAA